MRTAVPRPAGSTATSISRVATTPVGGGATIGCSTVPSSAASGAAGASVGGAAAGSGACGSRSPSATAVPSTGSGS